MQKSATRPSSFYKKTQSINNQDVTSKSVPKLPYSRTEDRAKAYRRQSEGWAKESQRAGAAEYVTISLLNIKRFTPNLSLCIIRNENEKISKFGN